MTFPESDAQSLGNNPFSADSIRQLGIQTLRSRLSPRTDGEPNQLDILAELEPVVASELNRHEGVATLWTPNDYAPVDVSGKVINRFGDPDNDSPPPDPAAILSLVFNLLTEDNLPSYHNVISDTFGRDSAWGNWVHRWTAEERRHAEAIGTYLNLTGIVDPAALEDERFRQVSQGYDSTRDPLHAIAYVTFQERATNISHSNTGKAFNDPNARAMLKRVADDETLHMTFYRNLLSKALELAPNQTLRAIADEVTSFEMPGANIDKYFKKSAIIAKAGIYNKELHHTVVLQPLLNRLGIVKLEGLGEEGETARLEIVDFMAALKAKVDKEKSRETGDEASRKANIARLITSLDSPTLRTAP